MLAGRLAGLVAGWQAGKQAGWLAGCGDTDLRVNRAHGHLDLHVIGALQVFTGRVLTISARLGPLETCVN